MIYTVLTVLFILHSIICIIYADEYLEVYHKDNLDNVSSNIYVLLNALWVFFGWIAWMVFGLFTSPAWYIVIVCILFNIYVNNMMKSQKQENLILINVLRVGLSLEIFFLSISLYIHLQ